MTHFELKLRLRQWVNELELIKMHKADNLTWGAINQAKFTKQKHLLTKTTISKRNKLKQILITSANPLSDYSSGWSVFDNSTVMAFKKIHAPRICCFHSINHQICCSDDSECIQYIIYIPSQHSHHFTLNGGPNLVCSVIQIIIIKKLFAVQWITIVGGQIFEFDYPRVHWCKLRPVDRCQVDHHLIIEHVYCQRLICRMIQTKCGRTLKQHCVCLCIQCNPICVADITFCVAFGDFKVNFPLVGHFNRIA